MPFARRLALNEMASNLSVVIYEFVTYGQDLFAGGAFGFYRFQ
jgi:hypothetical protein